jgi:ATP-dependent Lon protease
MTTSATHAKLPLLSLPDTVLVPHTTVPVQLEPPSFQALDEPVVDGDDPLGVVTVDAPEALPRTTLERRVIGLGRIIDTESLSGEGRLVYLKGLARGLITEAHATEQPVATVAARRIDEHIDAPQQADELVWSLRGGLLILQDRDIDGAEALNYEVSNLSAPGAVADVVGASIYADLGSKRQLLEQLDVLARLRQVDERLADLVVQAYESNPPEARERN